MVSSSVLGSKCTARREYAMKGELLWIRAAQIQLCQDPPSLQEAEGMLLSFWTRMVFGDVVDVCQKQRFVQCTGLQSKKVDFYLAVLSAEFTI